MLVTVGAAFLSSLDLFVVNVAFDAIVPGPRGGPGGRPHRGDLSWVLNAFAVAFAALLVPFGRLADRYGRERLFLAGSRSSGGERRVRAGGSVWIWWPSGSSRRAGLLP